MKTVRLKSMRLENYKGKGTHNFNAEFGNVTKISGRNRSGKSSVMDAYMETLTGKLADGSEPNSVRPHDENGNDINRDDVVRELVFDIDGTETTVKKTTGQKWVKKRGTTEEVFEGNKTTYTIDGFESSNQKAFTEWQEKIAKADTLLMCSNARPFLNTVQKSTAEARKVLEELAGFSTEKFIAENPKYAHIAEITKNHKIEDVLKQLRRDLNAQKKVANEAKVKLDYERAREISMDGGIELSELELAINALKEQIAELDRQETALDEAVKAYDESSSGILELKFELNGLQQKANEGLEEQRRELRAQINDRESEVATAERNIKHDSNRIEQLHFFIENAKKNLEALRADYKEQQNLEFDENSLVCSYCGQEYPEGRKEQIRADFESKKQDGLTIITVNGNSLKKAVTEKEEELQEVEATKAESEDTIKILRGEIAELEAQYNSLHLSIDISNTEEYKAIQSRIAEKEAALNTMNNHSEKRAEIRAERQQLVDEISEKRAAILKYQADEEQKDKNVTTLEQELKNQIQKQADIERDIDELMNFSIEKNQALAEKINPYFKHFHFQFLEFTQELSPVETLKMVCGGTSYNSGLNMSDKILCEIDLVCGLQALNGLNLCVWVDNTESINADRLNNFIEDLPQQIILLEKTEDEKLKVEIL